MQQHLATFIAEAGAAAGADLPQFVKDEFDAFLEFGILAHGYGTESVLIRSRKTGSGQ